MPRKTSTREQRAVRRGAPRRPDAAGTAAPPPTQIPGEVFERFPHALVVTATGGQVITRNAAARRMLGEGTRCCDLLGCNVAGTPLEHGCVTELALREERPLPEIRLDLPGPAGAAWVAAAPLDDAGRVVIHLRPGMRGDRRQRSEAHWINGPTLTVRCLGPLRIYSDVGEVTGGWLEQRPGQVLGYLLAERGRTVRPEVLAEALWPEADPTVMNTVRYFIHVLRDRLEPQRERRRPSSFVVFRGGGYAINDNAVRIDADDFEEAVAAGLAAAGHDPDRAERHLGQGLTVYQGDFLADQPYAEWARPERDRLHALASRAARALIANREQAGDHAGVVAVRVRLAELEPLDEDVHRDLIAHYLRDDRKSLAARTYAAFHQRMERELGVRPAFELADLSRAERDARG